MLANLFSRIILVGVWFFDNDPSKFRLLPLEPWGQEMLLWKTEGGVLGSKKFGKLFWTQLEAAGTDPGGEGRAGGGWSGVQFVSFKKYNQRAS